MITKIHCTSSHLMTTSRPDLDKAKYISLATYRKNGDVVRTPVWVAVHDGIGYIFSESNVGKVKRIRNNPKVQIAECDMRGGSLGEWANGTARLVDDPAEIEAMYPAFNKKYGITMYITNFLAKLVGRYQRRQIIAVTLD